MASALFDINDDGEDRGFQASNAQELSLRLRDPGDATKVVFQVWDPAGANPALGIAANPPRASKGCPALELVGATTGTKVSPVAIGDAVTLTTPATGGHSFLVRCIVDDGKRLVGDKLIADPTLIHERGVWTPTSSGLRKPVATEVAQFEVEGWAGALSDQIEASDQPSVPPAVLVTHYSANSLARTGYGDLADALGANYPSSFPSSAVYDIQPNAHAPSEGSYELDNVVTYVLRSALGQGAVVLPQLVLQSTVYIEQCEVVQPITGGILFVRDARVSAALATEFLDARDSNVANDTTLTVSGSAKLDRCELGSNVTLTSTADADALVTLTNCTFGAAPSIVFSGASPGVVRMDARSNFLFDGAGGSVTNGSIIVEALT